MNIKTAKLPTGNEYAAVKVIYDSATGKFYTAQYADSQWHWYEISEAQVIEEIKRGWTCVHTDTAHDSTFTVLDGSK